MAPGCRTNGRTDAPRWHDSRRRCLKSDEHHALGRKFGDHRRVVDASYDLVVIGGGSAGLTAAGFAASIGARVLIAAEQLGGDCTWTGCIPSKAFIRAARLVRDARRAASSGIGAGEVGVDFGRVMHEVRAAINRVYTFETAERLAKRGIEVASGSAHFADRQTIEVDSRLIHADRFIVSTGAAPAVPAIPGLDAVPYLTYETLFDSEHLPASLLVVGAGATGLELAQAFVRLGSRVDVVEQRSLVLPDADLDASTLIQRRLESEGISFHLSSHVSSVAAAGRRIELRVGAKGIDADCLLIAAGRRPRVDGLRLERAGIEVQNGAIRVNKNLRTSNPLVYAAGDVTGGLQFTHYAGWQGYMAARNALLPGSQDGIRTNIPWAVFTDPEVAQAGLTEKQARADISDVTVHKLGLDQVDRAQTEDERDGFIKLISGGGGKLLGATVVSRAAGETINELALAVDRGLSLTDLASTIHVYPTFGFGVQQLAADAGLQAIATGLRGKAVRALRRLS